MLTESRRDELVATMDYALNKYIEKNSVISNLAHDIASNEDELRFLKGLEVVADVFEVL